MTQKNLLSRRNFLRASALSSLGLVIGATFGCSSEMPPLAKSGQSFDYLNSAWLHLKTNGDIEFNVPRVEMGQGVMTALSMLIAEEMDADISHIKPAQGGYHPAFEHPTYTIQITGGSSSVKVHWDQLREIGAAARAMLVSAAAARMAQPVDSFTTRDSIVHHTSGRTFTYGELANDAARQSPPNNTLPKSPDQWRVIGHPVKRLDTGPKITGKPIYGVDVDVAGMLHATLKLSPVHGGRVKSCDKDAAMALPGVKAVVDIPHGVVVVADNYWRALKGCDTLDIQWDDGPNADTDSAGIIRMMAAATNDMSAPDPIKDRQMLDMVYEAPFLDHAPLEPMNCTAHVRPDGCEIWVPTQNPNATMIAAREVTGLDEDQIRINVTHLGGGFGRRLEADYVYPALIASRAVGKPVKLIYSREEDMRHGFYRAAKRVRFQIALDQDGFPADWRVKLASPSNFQRGLDANLPAISWFPVQSVFGDFSHLAGFSTSFTENNPFPYEVGNLEARSEIIDHGIPTGSHRSVQHSFSGFAKECAVDECARAAGQDPIAYRKRMLTKDPRYTGVLDLVAEKASWGAPRQGHHQGVALHRSFDTYVAQVAEISVQDGKLTIHRIVCAVDCGLVVNPAIAESQMTGAVLWGLEAALRTEITIEGGRTVQGNFDEYVPLTLAEAPPVEVHFVRSTMPPSGLGEPGTPPVAAALINAIFAATGTRHRTLPLEKHGIEI